MRSYTLENKDQDREFLSGKEVTCRAVVPAEETKTYVKAGENLLVILSSGKKYKGRINDFRTFPVKEYQVGELIIQRV